MFGYKVNVMIPQNMTLLDEEELEFFDLFYDEEKKVFDLTELMANYSGEKKFVPPKIQQSDEKFGFDSYHTLKSISNHLKELSLKYSDIMELFDLEGTTYEGRKIQAVRITNNVGNVESRDKPLIYLEGGIHSREWISPPTVLYLVESLIGHREKSRSAQTAALRETFQFVVIPVANPDGYVYSQRVRMWRKTRRPSGCLLNLKDCQEGCLLSECYGVDPNRNWDIDFGVKGASSEPCDDSFPGREPFNQNCVVMLRDFLVANAEKLVLSLSYHSYSQLFLYPWGHTQEETPDLDHHMKVGEAFSRAVAARHGSRYRNHPIVNIFHDIYPDYWYEVSGTNIDWAYLNLGLVDSYGVELRDEGDNNFLLPVEQILPTGEENFDGLLAVIENLEYFSAP